MTQREEFEAWAKPIIGDNPTWRESGDCELAWQAWQAAQAAQPSQALSLDLLERLSKTLTRLGYATPEGGMEHFNADLTNQLYNLCRAVDSLFDREQPPAPSDTAITYMTGYSDGREWTAAPIPQQPSVPEGWKQAVALAYGHLWHVNNEPMAPIPLRSSETAAYEARKQLRDLLTHEERGLAINRVQAMLSAAPQPKETK